MRDIERVLRDALRRQGEAYEPTDPYGARAAFVERLRRRRRRMYLRTGGVLAAVAALVAVLLIPGTVTEPDDFEFAVAPEVVATIPVGGAPATSSAAPDGTIWVATGQQVVAIDPEVNGLFKNVRTPGWSDEVVTAEDQVWVSTREGHIFLVDPQSGSILSRSSVPRAQPLDIAARDGSLWAVGMTDGRLYQTSPSSGGFEDQAGSDAGDDRPSVEGAYGPGGQEGNGLFEQRFDGMPLTDVAVGDAGLWVLFRNDDSAGIFSLDREDITTDESDPISVEVGDNPDLAVGLHAVWVATGTNGTVERIDPRTGEITATVEVGGRYTDLAAGDGVVWAVTGGDGPARLYQIGADGEFIGEPLDLEGDPVDVAVGAGAVWVSDQENGDVLRIESQPRDEEPAPEATPTATIEPARGVDPNELLFVYSSGGDLQARRINGSVKQITFTNELDVAPTVDQNARRVAFQRMVEEPDGDAFDCGRPMVLGRCVEESLIVNMDPRMRTEQVVGEGVSPSFGDGGRLAWIGTSDEGLPETIVIGDPSTSFAEQISFPLTGLGDITEIRGLQWARPASVDLEYPVLYFTAFAERTPSPWRGMYEVVIPPDHAPGQEVEARPISPIDMPPGSEIVAAVPSADGSGMDVLVLCCHETRSDFFSYAAIGRVLPLEGEYRDLTGEVRYVELRRLDHETDEGLNGSSLGTRLWDFDSLRGWNPTEDDGWGRGESAGGEEMWLVTDGYEITVSGDAGFDAPVAASREGGLSLRGLSMNSTP